MTSNMLLQWIEISRRNLTSNLNLYRKTISPKTRLMSVVKANAYGHGLEQVAPIVARDSDFLMVNTMKEALMIRHLKLNTRVLIAAPVSPDDFSQALKYRISLCAHSLDYLYSLSPFPIPVHLKVNTGTNRLGFSPAEIPQAVKILKKSGLKVEGIYTHFHSSDTGSPQSLVQLHIFNRVVSRIKHYFPHTLAHCSSSSSSLLWSQMRLDMIRLGISLYGLWPDPYVQKNAPGKKLKPVLSWKCIPVQSRTLKAGETVSYSATFTYKKRGFMAVLPVGYSDGYDRKLSNCGRVWFAGRYCPVIGRVAMNFIMIDTTGTDSDNLRGSGTVELIGPHVTADEIAAKTGTINYEVVSRLSPLIPRIIVE
jgi:alanine racemase